MKCAKCCRCATNGPRFAGVPLNNEDLPQDDAGGLPPPLAGRHGSVALA